LRITPIIVTTKRFQISLSKAVKAEAKDIVCLFGNNNIHALTAPNIIAAKHFQLIEFLESSNSKGEVHISPSSQKTVLALITPIIVTSKCFQRKESFESSESRGIGHSLPIWQ